MKYINFRRMLAIAVGFLLVCACVPLLHAAESQGVVEGVVRNANGQPVSGAFVKLKNAERRLTFMVISQAQGRYTADRLPPGQYVVQGVGNGFESGWSVPADVAVGKPAKVDLSLATKQGSMLAPAWPTRIPEDDPSAKSLPAGEAKAIIESRCTICHGITEITTSRFDRDGWEEYLHEMRQNINAAKLKDLTDEEAKIVQEYLIANYPPLPKPDPNSRLPRTVMKGVTAKYRVVQYELENTKADTHDIAVGPDGAGWSNQRVGGKLGRFDPETYEYTEFSPPLTKADHARLGNLQISSSGVVWMPDASSERRWLSFDIKTAKWTSHDFPTTIRGGSGGNTMAIAPDGTIWATGQGMARSYNPLTKEWKSFDSPTWLRTKINPGGYGITVAGDGKVWFAEDAVDMMARVDPATGKVDEFKVPVQGRAYPRRMNTDADGNVWVGLWSAGKLMKIDYKTAEMKAYDPPTPRNGAYSVSVDKTHNLVWVTLHKIDKLGRFNPKTGEWLEFPLPQAETDVRRIEVDQHHPNRVWWSTVGNFKGQARMGFVEVLDGSTAD